MHKKQLSRNKIKIYSIDLLTQLYSHDTITCHLLEESQKSHFISSKHQLGELTSSINKMNSNFAIKKKAEFKKVQEENNRFFMDYKNNKKYSKNKNPYKGFENLIPLYKRKAYKIPNLSAEHNIFKSCALLEDKKEGMVGDFLNGEKSPKNAFKYLNKLNKALGEIMHIAPYKIDAMNQELEYKTMTSFKSKTTEIQSEKDNLIDDIRKLLKIIKSKDFDELQKKLNAKLKFKRQNSKRRKSSRLVTPQFTNFQSKINYNSEKINTRRRSYNLNLQNLNNDSPVNTLETNRLISKKEEILYRTPIKEKRRASISKSRNTSNNFFGATSTSNFFSTRTTNFSNYNNGNLNFANEGEFLEYAYHKFIVNDYQSTEMTLIAYLKKYKNMTEEEINDILTEKIQECQPKKVFQHIEKLKNITMKSKLGESSMKIYLNNEIYSRIRPLLNRMDFQDKIISKFDYKMLRGIAPKE